MKLHHMRAGLFASAAICSLSFGAQAQDTLIVHGGAKNAQGATPRYAVIQRPQLAGRAAPLATLPPTWTYSFKYGGTTYNDAFIGTNPSLGTTAKIVVYVVPVKMVYGSVSYNPALLKENGVSITKNILNSPIFQKSVDYVQGGTNIGTFQYEDAFERANLWGTVASHPGSHISLSVKVEPTQTITVPANQGQIISAFGATNLIMANINWFDPKIQALITSLGIPSTALPLFITTQTYLASGNNVNDCCIGGYHSVNGSGQPYSHSTYITTSGAFAEDVSALSHELGEWIDDPYTNNNSPCGILEVGDPLEGNANYGTYPYTVNGVTWHLQDLATLPYFGAPSSITVHGWQTFQGESLSVCANGS